MHRHIQFLKQMLSCSLILSLLLFSCNKEEEKPLEETTEKWPIYGYQIFSENGYFYENDAGALTYRNRNHVYQFDESGNLVSHFEEKISNSELTLYPFMKDGSFYVTYRSTSYNSSDSIIKNWDYLWAYYRGSNADYAVVKMHDIRKKDPITDKSPDYIILGIQPDNLASGNHHAAWIFSMKEDSIYYKPVLSYFSGTHVSKEFVLPKGTPFGYMDVSNDAIVIYGDGCRSFNKNMEFLGSQNRYRLIPKIKLNNNFIFMFNGEYYTSTDGLTLKEKIPGFPKNEEKIFQSRDNYLFYQTGFYCLAVEAFSNEVVNRIDIRDFKMPVPSNMGIVADFYVTRNGISYIVKSNGIIVAK
jgi:hypothetical protein